MEPDSSVGSGGACASKGGDRDTPDGIRFSIEAIARVAWANRLDPLTAAFAEEAIAGSLTSTAAINRLALSCHGAGLVEADDFALAFGVSCLAIGHRIKLAWDPRHPFDVLVAVEEKDPAAQ